MRRPPEVVPADEKMVFEVEIANLGYGESTFFLYSEKRDNNAGLKLSIDGSSLNVLSPWRLTGTNWGAGRGGQASTSLLTVERGPKEDVYSPVNIILQSRCEFNEGEQYLRLFNIFQGACSPLSAFVLAH